MEVKKYNDQLISLQRLANLMITGATKTTPTYVLLNLLGSIPIDIKIRITATKTCLRLKSSNCWKKNQTHNTHTEIEKFIESLLEGQENDYCSPIWNLNNKFEVVINDKQVWNKNLHIKGNLNCWYSDASVKKDKTAVGIYNPVINKGIYFRLSDHCNTVQAELFGINLCAKHILDNPIQAGEVLILTDSLAALKQLRSTKVSSKTTALCRNTLNELGLTNNVRLGWVPGHSGIDGNLRADRIAKEGLCKNLIDIVTPINLGLVSDSIKKKEIGLANLRWGEVKINLKNVKNYIGEYNIDVSKKLLNRSRSDIRVLIGLSSGHGCCNKFLFGIGKVASPLCRFCNEGKEETIRHWLEECNELDIYRFVILGHRYINSDLFKTLDPSKLLIFARESKIYETFFFWQR